MFIKFIVVPDLTFSISVSSSLVFFTVKGFSLSTEEEEVCYGANFVLPFHLLPRPEEKIFFSPLKGGERKLIINNTMVSVK